MSKEVLRQKKLSFSEEDLDACKKGVLSFSLLKKLRQRFLIFIFTGIFFSLFFSGLLWVSYVGKESVVSQVGSYGEIFHPVLLCMIALFITLFGYVIINNLKKYTEANSELVLCMEASLNEIEYGITKNRSRAPYLKVKSLKFGPILPLKNRIELFNSGTPYVFYYSSKSKVLLAVSEQTNML